MAKLREEMGKIGLLNCISLLNSGNLIFETDVPQLNVLEVEIEKHMLHFFGFAIPVLLRDFGELQKMAQLSPLSKMVESKDFKLYVSFIKQAPAKEISMPWSSVDGAFNILEFQDLAIFSTLDLSVSKTTKGMENLEKLFGKNITTRNWNTVQKILSL